MMARLHEGPFSDEAWVFEIKWDGYRAIAECGDALRLYSRSGLNFAPDYPTVFEALKELKIDAVLDGEIVAFNEAGNPDFQLLQNARSNNTPLTYQVFDILYHNGESVQDKPLLERKALLKKLLAKAPDAIRYCGHIVGEGEKFFKLAQQKGLEGLIAKKSDSIYEEDSRSPYWLKIKHVQTDEAIICGYTEPKGTRKYFGALLLGMYQAGELIYIGHTGTGFNAKTLKELYETMHDYKQDDSPFRERVSLNSPATWLLPELVAAIKFSEITKDGIRRHPVFMGLRKDKTAEEVTGADKAPSTPKRGGSSIRRTPFWEAGGPLPTSTKSSGRKKAIPKAM